MKTIVAQKLEKFTCFCPQPGKLIQHSMTLMAQMTTLGPLIIILWIHWELVKWISSLLVGVVVIGEEYCGSEVGKIHLFLSPAWETHPTFNDPHRMNEHLRTIDHHSLDPLGACEMD